MTELPRSVEAVVESLQVPVRPLVRLSRCMSVEEVLNHLADIIKEKGINPRALRVIRAGHIRDFKLAQDSSTATDHSELVAIVEGRKTRLIVEFSGAATSETRCEIEDVALVAAQRIELLCERRMWSDTQGAKKDRASQPFDNMIGNSEPMLALVQRIESAARSCSTVLITGESGTGKELAARAIHNSSPRAAGPFVAINCGAFTEGLLESELFGYVKGAFTGAMANRKGLFEAAHKGTIFLDEIGEAPLSVQLRLLRVLQERKVRPVGAHDEKEVDVRVIVATNRDLYHEVEERRFRHDLYFRLHVLAINMPPLRQRDTDLLLLTKHFLDNIGDRLGYSYTVEIEEEAIEALCTYRWPGNVRELEAMIERMASEVGDGGCITVEQVRSEIGAAQWRSSAEGEIEYVGVLRAGEPLGVHLKRQETMLYDLVRSRMGGNHSQAARWLGMERTALYRRVDRARQRTCN
jgi:transcriptional regulator with PAS, ATPase and Fis domain